MKFKRFLAGAAAVLMLAATPILPSSVLFAPITAKAAELVSGNYTYAVKTDGTAEIIGYKGKNTANLQIPSALGGKKVTSVNTSAFSFHHELTSVTIPNTVTAIGNYAFNFCGSLKKVTLQNGLKTIGDGAFEGCSALKSVSIPSTVTKVGYKLLSGTGYDVSANYKNYALYLSGWLLGVSSDFNAKSFTIPAGTVGVADQAFEGNENTEKVVLPASLRYVGDGAFSELSALKNIELTAGNKNFAVVGNVLYNAAKTRLLAYPSSKADASYAAPSTLTSVAPFAVYINDNIQSVTLPNSVTDIGNHAFYWCENLKSVQMPSGLKTLGVLTFGNCSKLENITLPAGVTELPAYVFQNCLKLPAITFPSGLKSIGDGAFTGCETLAKIDIPESVTKIGDKAFEGCQALTSVRLPSTLKVLQASVFENCEALQQITLPQTLTEIEYGVFQGSGLTSIDIPDSVTEIGDSAFRLSQLKTAKLPKGLTAIRFRSFDGLPLEQVNIPKTVKVIENGAFSGSCFESIELPQGLTAIWPEAFSHCRQLKSIDIPDSVTQMGNSVFEYCDALNSVTLSKNIKVVDDFAFRECRTLESITIPEGVGRIGHNAFNSCYKLATVNLPSTLKEIGDTAFGDCEVLSSLSLPDGLETVGDSVFAGTMIANVNCPSALKKVGYNPFDETPFSKAQSKEGIYWGDWIIGYENFEDTVDTVNIKDGTKHIADHVFAPTSAFGHNNYYMKYIDLPESLVSIGEGALAYNSFTSVTIPKNVVSIDDYAFSTCHDLVQVTLNEGLQSLGEGVFTSCGDLIKVNMPSTLRHMSSNVFINTQISKNQENQPIQYVDKWVVACQNATTEMTVKDGTVGICDFAFYGRGINKLTVPESVKYIGEQAMGYRMDGTTVYVDNKFNLHCYPNSAAHEYAKKYGIAYTLICNHQYKETGRKFIKATFTKDGGLQASYRCTICDGTYSKMLKTVSKVSTIKLSATKYTYDGKVKTPSVTVKDSKGKLLKKNSDYTVSYAANRKAVGRYTAKVTLKGKNYSGSKTLSFDIDPKGTSVTKLSSAKKGFKATWKKQKVQISGYELQYGTGKKFKSAKAVLAGKGKASVKIGKLSAKKKYFVRIRTYKNVKIGGRNVKFCSDWSKAKSVVTKK